MIERSTGCNMCCGNGGKKAIRSSQVVSRQQREPQKVIVQRLKSNKNAAAAAPVYRQYAVPRDLCPRCQNTTMVVHIAGRERQQCTNINCRFVLT